MIGWRYEQDQWLFIANILIRWRTQHASLHNNAVHLTMTRKLTILLLMVTFMWKIPWIGSVLRRNSLICMNISDGRKTTIWQMRKCWHCGFLPSNYEVISMINFAIWSKVDTLVPNTLMIFIALLLVMRLKKQSCNNLRFVIQEALSQIFHLRILLLIWVRRQNNTLKKLVDHQHLGEISSQKGSLGQIYLLPTFANTNPPLSRNSSNPTETPITQP